MLHNGLKIVVFSITATSIFFMVVIALNAFCFVADGSHRLG